MIAEETLNSSFSLYYNTSQVNSSVPLAIRSAQPASPPKCIIVAVSRPTRPAQRRFDGSARRESRCRKGTELLPPRYMEVLALSTKNFQALGLEFAKANSRGFGGGLDGVPDHRKVLAVGFSGSGMLKIYQRITRFPRGRSRPLRWSRALSGELLPSLVVTTFASCHARSSALRSPSSCAAARRSPRLRSPTPHSPLRTRPAMRRPWMLCSPMRSRTSPRRPTRRLSWTRHQSPTRPARQTRPTSAWET